MAHKGLAFVEQRAGAIKKRSLEALSLGKRLAGESGGTLAAVVAGEGVAGLAPRIAEHGADAASREVAARLRSLHAEEERLRQVRAARADWAALGLLVLCTAAAVAVRISNPGRNALKADARTGSSPIPSPTPAAPPRPHRSSDSRSRTRKTVRSGS